MEIGSFLTGSIATVILGLIFLVFRLRKKNETLVVENAKLHIDSDYQKIKAEAQKLSEPELKRRLDADLRKLNGE